MKTRATKFVAAGIAVIAAGVLYAEGDVLSRLKLSEAKAKEEVVWSLHTGQVPVSQYRATFKAATPAVRATLVQGALAFAKAYTATPQFAAAYAAARDEAKPEGAGGETVDQRIKREVADLRKQMASINDATVKQGLEEMLRTLQSAEYRDMVKAEMEGSAESSREELARWNEEYPADPKVLIRRRLQEFLRESADVDYAAKTVQKNGKLRFANETYEGEKSGEWKLCYRAGKEPVDAARAFATQWLKELK